ncbi:hypothetical protein QAD02_006988 [Eretmocerus hayati]|uniref:Uncharacterized protein n=1 Tax=Eretmocerus hayati TaxID=131215 RepID=A0ACC2N368_9HYME|nr:hypothetical protein QAD02_006988 [Eretmocerus hayati]
MDPNKLKVVELRAELQKRGLDTKGNKPVLVERLRQALEEEKADPSKAPSEASEKSEKDSESEEEEPVRRTPRTPARSSRNAAREAAVPTRTPTRRSSSRSSLSRQSPAKSTAAESVSEASALEPIVEEDKASPKKESTAPSPASKKVTPPAPASKKETPPTPSSKKAETAATPEPSTTKGNAPTPSTPAESKTQVAAEAPTTPEAKKLEDSCSKATPQGSNKPGIQLSSQPVVSLSPLKIPVQTPVKSIAVDSPAKPTQQSPARPITADSSVEPPQQSPAKAVAPESPAKPPQQSPAKPTQQSPAKPITADSPVESPKQSPAKALAPESPAKPPQQSPAKPDKPPQQSPAKPDIVDSPVKPQEIPVQAAQQSPAKSLQQSPAKPSEQSPSKSMQLSPAKPTEQSPAKSALQSPVKPGQQSPAKPPIQSPVISEQQSPAQSPVQSPVKAAQLTTPAKDVSPQKIQQSTDRVDVKVESPAKRLKSEEDSQALDQEAVKGEPQNESDAVRKSVDEPMEVDQENDSKTSDTDRQQESKEDRKRKRSPSPREEAPRAPPVARPENEPTYDEDAVLLSWYDSDLNLVIDPTNYCSASSMQGEGFNYIWAGVRASHGFTKGKVFYEARVHSEFDNVAAAASARAMNSEGALPVDEHKIPSILRIGWSTIGTSLQLGEEKLSYGYEGTGKKSTNNEFTEYGKTFAKNDVVGCFIDFESGDDVIMSYTVNGENQGTAFTVKKEDLSGKALIPHILARNCAFKVNFGQEEPWSKEIPEGFSVVGKVDINDRQPGHRRPEKRADCEIVLLCGLPFSGKTTWATDHISKNPEKLYYVLGTHHLIERMRVEGMPLKDQFKGRWETVVEKCSRALTKLLEMAPSRRRNYILDQTANVYGSNQKRKMRNFYGFHRKAVVFVPSDEEFKSRIEKHKEGGNEEIRESSILEMKALLNAPNVGESFEEVVWAELGEEDGKKLVENYNSEGKTAGYGQSQEHQNKRSRYDNHSKDRNNRDNRNRPGFDRRSSGPGWRSGGGGGGGGGRWDGGGNRMRGGPMRHGGGYGGPAPWQSRGGAPPNRRPDDRRQGGDRRGGGWNASGYQGNRAGGWQGSQWSGGQQSGGGAWNQGQAWGGAGAWKGYQGGGGTQHSYGNWGNGNSQYYNQQQGYWSGQSGGQGGGTQSTTGQNTKK